jgi:ectoine hydroxylase-related dioxygenase (phytanoyl-CoA dioxygenase family)
MDTRTIAREMDVAGFVILPAVLDATQVAGMIERLTILAAGRRADPTVRKGGVLSFDDVIDAGSAFEAAYNAPEILGAVETVLGAGARATRVNYRAPLPGYGAQALHTDYLPVRDRNFIVATAIVALVDFTAKNGAPRVVPGTQLIPKLDVPKSPDIPFRGECTIECPAGSALVFNGHLWHSGTRNASNSPRHALQITYSRV